MTREVGGQTRKEEGRDDPGYSPHLHSALNPCPNGVFFYQKYLQTPLSLERPTRFDIAAVFFLLSSLSSPLERVLPPEIALQIIHLAEYWQPWKIYRSAERRVPNYDENLLYLSTPSIPHVTSSSKVCMVQKLIVRTNSYGRVAMDHTWFEGAIIQANWKVDDEPTLEGLGNVLEADERVNLDRESVIFTEHSPRWKLFENDRSSRDYSIHEVVLRVNSCSHLLGEIESGKQIGFFVRAIAPGWANFIKEMTCVLYIAWI